MYKCESSNINITTQDAITKIEGQHESSQSNAALSNDNVNALRIFEQICHFFPSGIEKFLKNLEGIAVQNSQLRDIRKNDLKPFRELKSLSLYGNNLISLEFGLFVYNKKLELVSIYNNKLLYIASDFFEINSNLKKAIFTGNLCVDFGAFDENEIIILKQKINENCKPTFDMIHLNNLEVKSTKLEDDYNKISSNYFQQSNELKMFTNQNENLKNSLTKITENATCTVNKILEMEKQKCELKLHNLMMAIKNIDLVCDFYDGETCVADDLIIFHEDMEVKVVKDSSETIVDPLNVVNLEIHGRNSFFMPINLGR